MNAMSLDEISARAAMRRGSRALLAAILSPDLWPCGHYKATANTHRIGVIVCCKSCRRARWNRGFRRVVAMHSRGERARHTFLKRHIEQENAYIAGGPGKLSAHALVESVAEGMKVTPADIMGGRRLPRMVCARGIVAMILHERGMSYAAIGRVLADRDHSTVINLVDNFERYVARSELVLPLYRKLRDAL